MRASCAQPRDDLEHRLAVQPIRVELVRDDADADREVVADPVADGTRAPRAGIVCGPRGRRRTRRCGRCRAARGTRGAGTRAPCGSRHRRSLRPGRGRPRSPTTSVKAADVVAVHLAGRVSGRRREYARRGIHGPRAVRSVGLRLRAVVVELHEDARSGLVHGIRHALDWSRRIRDGRRPGIRGSTRTGARSDCPR